MKAISLNRVLMILAFAGLFVASYLALAHYIGANVACGSEDGCGKVASSHYSRLLGIPIAYFGVGAYAMFLALALIRTFIGDKSGNFSKLGMAMSGIGVVLSAILIYLSIAVIQATCWWCVASSLIMIGTFVVHVLLVRELPLEPSADGLLVGGLAAALVVGMIFMGQKLDPILKAMPGKTVEDFIPKDPHFLGEADAPVVIVEFADLTCGHCQKSYAEFRDLIENKHAHLKVVFRHFPLVKVQGHEMALPAAVVSEMCAEKGRFFPFIDLVYNTATKDLTVDKMLEFASIQGVSPEEARRRILDEKDPAFIRAMEDFNKGNELGLLQTPTFYIGRPGKQVYPAKQAQMRQILMSNELQPLWDPTFKR